MENKNLSAPARGVTPGVDKIEYRYGLLIDMETYTAVLYLDKKELMEWFEYYQSRGNTVQAFEQVVTTKCKIIDLKNEK